MAKVHVLAGDRNVFQIIAHVATPAGTNTAGVTWKNAIVNSGMNKTVMVVGTGPGQMLAAEKALIDSGDLIEARAQYGIPTDAQGVELSGQPLIDDLNLRADQTIAERIAQLATQLKYYGYSAG